METAKKKILVVEDALDYQLIIQSALNEDYELTMATTGQEAFQALEQKNFDLILLDIILPDQDGYQICAMLRGNEKTTNVPIIFVTSKESIPDKVMGFSLGGDDYVTKPFDILELKARISAKIRNSNNESEEKNIVTRGQIEINVPCQRVYIIEDQQKVPIDFTSTEFNLLLFMTNHLDHVLNRTQILDAVWGDSLNVTERTVDTHVSKVRKKLRSCSHYIESVHGSGYRFSVKENPSEKSEKQVA